MQNQLIENSREMTPEREREMIIAVQTGTKDEKKQAIGELIEAQSKWIMTCIIKLSPPKWMDSDVIFADVMPTIIQSLDDFDLSRNTRLTTFIATVTRRSASRIIRRAVQKSRRECETTTEDIKETREDRKLVEVEELAQAIHDMLSSDSLSQRSKFIIDRLARGVTREEICSQLGATPSQLAAEMRRIQNTVAIHITRKSKITHEGIIPNTIIERAEKAIPVRDVFGRVI